MQKTTIPYSQTGYFSKLILDYLEEDDFLKPFYHCSPNIQSFEKAIAEKSTENIDRTKLSETILKQYAGIELNDTVKNNISLFQQKNTFCIVTAHQLNIFTGPLYVIYKIISTINTCKILKEKYPAYDFVPVYWLGSEDHDFAEINHFNLFGKTFTWDIEAKGATGKLNPASILSVLDALKPVLGESENAKIIYNIFHSAYTYSSSLTEATKKYLNALFGKYGLVIVDGDDTYFKTQCIDIISDEIFNQSSLTVVQKINALLSVKYQVQANPREINLFYLNENIRERVVFDSEKKIYAVLNTNIQFSKEEI
ncbi:MAG: bacillithiol biosynthesis BshC, partial [Fimbriimonadaceae bacterium]|nr:bacillithiol biosynthesis BshC [Chitinophagales bacterium]